MNRILNILSKGQEPTIRRLMFRRVSALMAGVRHMHETRAEQFMFLHEQGWTMENYEVIFAMNSFYLFVLGPLASSAEDRTNTVWKNTPISYGKDLLFDKKRAQQIQIADTAFSEIARRIPGGIDTLVGNKASDIVYKLYKSVKNDLDL